MGTPADLVIHPRDRSFGCGTETPHWWAGNDPIATAYYNTWSASFPQAERYFIESMRRYRDRAGPQLRREIAAFIAQESVHAREHITFNRDAVCGGFDLTRIDALLKKQLTWARTLTALKQIASVAALEHFTATLSHEVIADPRHLGSAPAQVRNLMYWHAGEEVEHKAVAFDTFMLAAESLSPLSRWLLRCQVMVASTVLLVDFLLRSMADFFRQDGIATFGIWMRFLHFAFVRPGVIRPALLPYLAWYLPGFHPWQRDDSALIAKAEEVSATPA